LWYNEPTMPKREDDIYRHTQGHPPNCTCADCASKRMRGETRICPSCGHKSLVWNRRRYIYECGNAECQKEYSEHGYLQARDDKLTPPDGSRVVSGTDEGPRAANLYVERTPVGGTTPAREISPPSQRGRRHKTAAIVVLLVVIGVIIGVWHNQLAEFFGIAPTGSNEPTTTANPPASGDSPSPVITEDGFSVHNDVQPLYAKTSGIQVNLTNSPSATNPTWQQLVAFISDDGTDEKTYDEFSFPCGAFAEEVHNNAEAAGIKTAWVAVEFSDQSWGHACNAFQTTDKGLVFIDCTGEDLRSKLTVTPAPIDGTVYGEVDNRDTVAYIELDEIYGLISMGNASNYGLDYSGYIRWQQDMSLFDSELASYNEQLGGRTVVPPDEYGQLLIQAKLIGNLAEKIGGFYQPMGTVTTVEIYW
jgi:hypothetical protein